MKRLFTMMVLLLTLLSYRSASADPTTYTFPYRDGFVGTVEVTDDVVFTDYGGPDGVTKASTTGYVLFKSANDGSPLSIEFSQPVEFTSNQTHLYVYEGDCLYNDGSASGGWKKDVPAGWVADLKNGDTLTFTANSGSISVLYYCPVYASSESGAGWIATVKSGTPKEMEWKQLSVTDQLPYYCYAGVRDLPLLRVDMETDGSLNPLETTKLAFSISGGDFASLTNVRCLYSGSSNNFANATAFGETQAAATATMTFNGNAALRNGHNYFWLVADVAEDTAIGSKYVTSLTSAIVSSEERVAAELSGSGWEVAPMLFMEAGEHSYNVGEYSLNFYDDGGPDGNYTKGFNGTATFVPTVEGKKVMIDFKFLDLFNNSSAISVGNNDVIRVYSGTEVNADNLIDEIIQNDLKTLHSVSADGALTVTFSSKTGYPTKGFAAEVSLFEPSAMTADAMTVEAASKATLYAGSTMEPLTLLNVHTVNTEPALSASKIDVAMLGTANLVSKIYVKYLGKNKNASGTVVGELAAGAQNLQIPVADVVLNEGDNYFAICADVASAAANGDQLGAEVKNITLNGNSTAVENGNPGTLREVFNQVVSQAGTHTYSLYGEWTFANAPSEYSYYGYDDVSGAQTTTFLPGENGYIVEMEFSKLSISFPSYSYGSDPYFKIIDGDSPEGTVLYTVTKANKDEVPETVFRSTHSSGALTVVFNTNGQRGTLTSNGFTAKVRPYKERPMVVQNAEAFQASVKDIAPGSVDNEIIGVKVNALGALNPKALESVKLNLKGSAPYIKNVKLFATGTANNFNPASEALATVEVAGTEESVTLSLNGEDAFTLPERDSYFWITYDMNDICESDVVIDASLEGVTASGQNVEVTVADPDGSRTVKNIYYFQNGNNTVMVDGSLMFYDDGGPEGKYTTANKGTVTFKPTEGKIVKFIFHSFYTNVNDDFYVYNGTSTEKKDQLLQLYSNKPDVAPVVSTADDGALTVKFEPSRNNINDGWAIEVVAFVPEPLVLESVTATPACAENVLRGSENNVMMGVKYNVTGERGNIEISKLLFNAVDSNRQGIGAAKLWYTGTDASFNTVDLYAESTADALSFDGNVRIKQPGEYYFWLTYDIKPDAAAGSSFESRFTSTDVNGETIASTSRVIAATTLGTGRSGNITVGASEEADYATIQEALNSLKTGIDGPVVIEVEDGEYNELVNIEQYKGASSINTLTLRSKSGSPDKAVVSYQSYPQPSDYADQYGVLTFNGCDYTTVEGMTFTTGNTKFDAVVYVKNEARHNTFRHNVVKAETTTSYSDDINLFRMYARDENNRNNDFMTIEGNEFVGGYIGTTVGGTAMLSCTRERGAVIKGNTYRDQGSKAIYLQAEFDATVDGNYVVHTGTAMATGYNAMDIYRCNGNLVVSNNIIDITDAQMGSGSSGSNCTGIYLRDISSQTDTSLKHIFNNDISIHGTAAKLNTLTGFQLQDNISGQQKVELVNNTIAIRGNGTDTSSAMYLNDTLGDDSKVINNIFQNESGSYAVRIQRDNYCTGSAFSNNTYYTSGETLALIAGDDKSFDDLKAFTGEENALNEKAVFVDSAIHELAEAGGLQSGVSVDYITSDLNGRQRPADNVTLGAYEFAAATAAPVMLEGYPAVTEIGYDKANVNIATDIPSKGKMLVVKASENIPSQETVMAQGTDFVTRSVKPYVAKTSGLEPNTEYKAYMILSSFNGLASDLLSTEIFKTGYLPTSVSTFENVTEGDGYFEDGTARFYSFDVIDHTGGPGLAPAAKVARLSGTDGIVELTNAQNLTLDGFFMKNEGEVTLNALDPEGETTATKTLSADEWHYVNLRDMGAMTMLSINSEAEVLIDDFSGTPLMLETEITSTFDEGNEGSEATFTSSTTGGVKPYSYTWRDASGRVFGTGASATDMLRHSTSYILEVKDAWNHSAKTSTDVIVKGSLHVATFDDLYLDPETHWAGDEDGTSAFYSGSFSFPNYYNEDYASWAYFGYSNSTSTNYTGIADQYNSAVGGGVDGSGNYGVVYASPYYGPCAATVTSNDDGETIEGMWVTNNAWVVDAVLNGDGMSTQPGGFAKDDYLKLTVTGTHADDTTSALDVYLADYRSENEADRYVLETWEWVDLKPLGTVKKLAFSIAGTKSNSYGLTTPTYFCLDNLGGEKRVEARDTVIADFAYKPLDVPLDIDLSPMFDFNPDEATVNYDIDVDPENATVLDNGHISVPYNGEKKFYVAAHAVQKGRHQYLTIPVKVLATVGLGEKGYEGIRVYPIPADDHINVATDMTGYDVEVYDISGRLMLKSSGCDGFTSINLDGFSSGAYIMHVIYDDGVYNKKFIKK